VLLETIYSAFDALAKERRVFKVETIGDSYVAVTGLPNPNAKHAISMARFAVDCLSKFHELTKQLEVT
jgi:class 3 adenylate cyclase